MFYTAHKMFYPLLKMLAISHRTCGLKIVLRSRLWMFEAAGVAREGGQRRRMTGYEGHSPRLCH